MKLNSHQLRKSLAREGSQHQKNNKKNPIVLVLDNVLDTYNIGSFFRLADALNVEKICLCGPVVTPPNLKIHRASIGTWKWVTWEQYQNTDDCLKQLKKDGYTIYACEQKQNSVLYHKAKYKFPLAIVAGSEMNGIGESTLKLCDHIIEIPMYGINISLNVLIATSIIGFEAAKSL
ncbi:MAG: TrmH family RNA methyltransferase [Candidatus Shapirobacteria bacterium]